MASAFCSRHLYRPIPVRFRQSIPTKPLQVPNSSRKPSWLLRNIQAQQHNKTDSIDAQRLMELLYEDLKHVFDEQGIDKSMYDDRIKFRDPITKYDSIDGYLFNIWMLKVLFQPEFQIHSLKQTGPSEIRIRWTTMMKFTALPWKPELVLTGESIMGIDPETRKFCSHVDTWDCIENNNYFSLEGLLEVLKQLSPVGMEPVPLQICKITPDLDTPKYQILKRTANYEVRKYSPFSVVESRVDKLSGCGEFNNFTDLPMPNGDVKIIETGCSIAAVKKFSGIPAEEEVKRIEKDLRAFLQNDGLKPRKGISTFVMV